MLVVCQASALPLSYAPRFKIREGFIYSELFPKSTPKFSVSQIFSGTNPLALVGAVLARWVSTVSGWGGQGEIFVGMTEKMHPGEIKK